jgi:predicted Ser/Thr protein kinase
MPIVVGQTLGQYRIQEKIGEGGMGVVYKAEQAGINRIVVIKVLTANLATDKGALDRFKREVDIIAELEHPYILPLYDFGQVDDNPYIVMRFMGGGSLSDRLRAGNLTQDQRMRILEQTAEALDYAHDRDIIHRDLKPANILLDERGNAYLADFGLAKTMEGTRDLTKTGSVLGTPAYMSPEQARGDKLDRRSDIYAFAVLTYEALGGRLPFTAKTTWEYIQKHLVEPPPSILTIAPKLPPALDAVLQAGLAKDREARPSSAVEFIKSVQVALGGGQVSLSAVPSGTFQPTAVGRTRSNVPAATRAGTMAPLSAASSAAPASVAPAPARSAATWALPAVGVVLGGGLILAAIAAVIVFVVLQGNVLGSAGPQVNTYAVGRSPRALLFDGQSIWVANTSSDTVVRLTATSCAASADPCGKTVGTAVPVDTLPVALAYDGKAVWVASALNSTLTKFDVTTGQPSAKYHLKSVPSALVYADNALWSSDSINGSVTRIGLDGTSGSSYAVGQSPISLTYEKQHLWIAAQADSALVELDPVKGSVVQTVKLEGQPYAVAFDGKLVWAALGDQDKVVAVNPADGKVAGQVAVGKRPVALLFDGTSLWSADQKGNSLTRIDVANFKAVATISVPGGPYALASAACGSGCEDIWVADEANSAVSRVRIKP